LDSGTAGHPAGERLRLTGHLTWLLRAATVPDARYRSPFTQAFDDVWQELAAPMSPAWRGRFLQSCLDYLHAAVWEAQNRARGTPPGTVEYVRRHSSGSRPHLDVIEYATGSRLPVGFHDLPAIRAALTAAADITGWHHDLVALPQDTARGEPNNLVHVIAWERRCDRDTALTLARAQLRRRLHDFDRATARHRRQSRLTRHRNTHGPDATRYLAGLRAWVHTTLTWNASAQARRRRARHRPFVPELIGMDKP
jgi:hypothetical protein